MYKQHLKKGLVDWDSILYEFPGKTMIFVKEFCSKLKVNAKFSIQQADNSSEPEERKDEAMDCGEGSDDSRFICPTPGQCF